MKIEEISALISVRHYADRIIDNYRVKLSKEDANNLEKQIVAFDNRIVQEILSLSVKGEKTKEEETKNLAESGTASRRPSVSKK